jgi:hypothetical protein
MYYVSFRSCDLRRAFSVFFSRTSVSSRGEEVTRKEYSTLQLRYTPVRKAPRQEEKTGAGVSYKT